MLVRLPLASTCSGVGGRCGSMSADTEMGLGFLASPPSLPSSLLWRGGLVAGVDCGGDGSSGGGVMAREGSSAVAAFASAVNARSPRADTSFVTVCTGEVSTRR